jgi:RNA polymerase sigma-70 factor (ECF subfamily)
MINNQRRGDQRRARLAARAAAEPVIVDETPAPDLASVVQRAFDSLAELDREALRLAEWEQLSPTDAAVVLGCSAATFRVRLHRARRRLAAAVLAANGEIAASVSNEDVIA